MMMSLAFKIPLASLAFKAAPLEEKAMPRRRSSTILWLCAHALLFALIAPLGCTQKAVIIKPWATDTALQEQASDSGDPATTLTNGVEEFEIKGLQVIFKRTPGKPVVSVGAYFRGGSAQTAADEAGLDMMTLRLLSSGGTLSRPRDAMNAAIGLLGASFSSDAGAHFSVLSMQALHKNWDASFEIFADMLQNPAWPADEFERQRARHLEFLSSLEESADRYVSLLADSLLYEGHPYAQRAWGNLENIGRFNLGDLRARHQKLLVKKRMLFVIVGDLERAELEEKLSAAFASLPDGANPEQPLPALSVPATRMASYHKATPTSYVLAKFAAPAPDEPDYYPLLAGLAVLSDRLFEKVRSDMQLSYAVAAGLNTDPINSGYLYVSSSSAELAYSQILDEVESMQDWLINERELEQQIAIFVTGFFMDLESLHAQRQMLARAELLRGDWRKASDIFVSLRAVSPRQVRDAMRKYVQKLQIGYYGPSDGFRESLGQAEPNDADRVLLQTGPVPSTSCPDAPPAPTEAPAMTEQPDAPTE
jgi:predicted Zn-dependent peptidase